jgi:hypothetical protein
MSALADIQSRRLTSIMHVSEAAFAENTVIWSGL